MADSPLDSAEAPTISSFSSMLGRPAFMNNFLGAMHKVGSYGDVMHTGGLVYN